MPESKLSGLRVRLIQARGGLDMETQEQECFIERCGITVDQLVTANVVRDEINDSLAEDIDAVLIGGAGEFSAYREYPWMPRLLKLVGTCIEKEVPLFGSCWGHQVIARALGGTVEHDKQRAEMGCGEITLTEDGRKDPLFASYPTTFLANMGHHDRITRLPDSAIELARSATQGNQAFRVVGLPVYGTQFHSELDAARERERLLAYRQFYLETVPDEADFWKKVDSLQETTEVDKLLHDFLVMYCT